MIVARSLDKKVKYACGSDAGSEVELQVVDGSEVEDDRHRIVMALSGLSKLATNVVVEASSYS